MIVRKMRTHLKSNLKTIHNVSPLRGVKTPKSLHNARGLTIQSKSVIMITERFTYENV